MQKEEFRICPFCRSKIPASLDKCPICHRIIVERAFIYVDGKPYNNQSVKPPETNASVKPPKPRKRRTLTKGRIFWSIFAIVLISWMTFAIVHSVSKTYTITAFAGSNGSISPSGSIIVKNGNNQTFTITPSLHYHVADILVDNVSVGAVTSYNFNSVAESYTIAASFTIDTNVITASAGSNGSISPSGSVAVNYGTGQAFTITADSGQTITSVTVDGVNQGVVSSYIFNNVIINHTISATFSNTVTFRIGTIDPRFNMSMDTISKIANDAANRWNKAAGRNLLAYNTDGDVQINLVYDYRQEYVNAEKKINSEYNYLSSVEASLNAEDNKINKEQHQLDLDTASYNRELASLNKEIDYWNSVGGALPGKYEELNSKSRELESKSLQLDRREATINREVQDYNAKQADYNEKVNEEKAEISALNNEFPQYQNDSSEATVGEYYADTNTITIYAFNDKSELLFILMHEFGHALGCEHAQSKNSIMYLIIDESTVIANPKPSTEDLELINHH